MRISKQIGIFFALDATLSLAYLGNYFAGEPHWLVSIMLDLDGEDSVCAWYSSIKFFCIFLLGLLFASKKYNPKNTSTYLLFGLPAIFLFFSIDESVMIHEWLGLFSDRFLPEGTRKATIFHETGIWMFVLGIPFLIVFSWLAYLTKSHFAEYPGSLTKIVTGMMILLLGALGIETVGNFEDGSAIVYMLQVFFEESFEMLGATIMLWGMYETTVEYLPFFESPIRGTDAE